MRIALDLQACQSVSRDRGIGRYSMCLARAMALRAGDHEIHIVLNSSLPDSIEHVRSQFDGLIPQSQISVAELPREIAAARAADSWRSQAARLIMDSHMANLAPDVVHVASLFEGLNDDVVSSTGCAAAGIPTAVTLYDLIPLAQRAKYLKNEQLDAWYFGKLRQLSGAQALLAISDFSKTEAVELLDFPEERIATVYPAVDEVFHPRACTVQLRDSLAREYGIDRPYIMYTGGVDERKNTEGLVRSYAQTPESIRKHYQLAIICRIGDMDRTRLVDLARRCGLAADSLVFTGFVDDERLADLYSCCSLFVFPSLWEGFGLPVLEAMSCGAPVVASETTSIPEVVGNKDMLFDPTDDTAIAAKITRVLVDDALQSEMRRYGLARAQRFSWATSADKALETFEGLHSASRRHQAPRRQRTRPRLAYISPLPPSRSGVADHSVELLPYLSQHYEIGVVTESGSTKDPWVRSNLSVHTPAWFQDHAHSFDRVLFQMGNSVTHHYMFDLLERFPGVVALHNFFLGQALRQMDASGYSDRTFPLALYRSHGYPALIAMAQSEEKSAEDYPCNKAILDHATGIIVHSGGAMHLADTWYGPEFKDHMRQVPLAREASIDTHIRNAARASLGLTDEDFLVCSFGKVAGTHLSHRLVDSWLGSPLESNQRARLAFVGECSTDPYSAELTALIEQSHGRDQIIATGQMDGDTYRRYLAAADMAVQLRTDSRGDISASTLDCLAHGIPIITNSSGSACQLPEGISHRLPMDFSREELTAAILELRDDHAERCRLAVDSIAYVRETHAPGAVSDMYCDAIEHFAISGRRAPYDALLRSIAAIPCRASPNTKSVQEVATCIAANLATKRLPHLLLDVTEMARDSYPTPAAGITHLLDALLRRSLSDLRVEAISFDESAGYRYCRSFIANLEGLAPPPLGDDVVETNPGDIILGMGWASAFNPERAAVIRGLRDRGLKVYWLVGDLFSVPPPTETGGNPKRPPFLYAVASLADGLVSRSTEVHEELSAWLSSSGVARSRPMKLACIDVGIRVDPESAEREETELLLDLIQEGSWQSSWPPVEQRLAGGTDSRPATTPGPVSPKRLLKRLGGSPLLFDHGNLNPSRTSAGWEARNMSVTVHPFDWPLTRPFDIAVDAQARDAYADMIRASPPLDPAVALMAHFSGRGKKFIDLGANIGYYTLPLANAGSRVLAVEALPRNAAVLAKSIVCNGFRNVTLVHAAAHDETGVIGLSGTGAWARVTEDSPEYEVPCLTLDDLTALYDFRDASAMKMDVEGAELAVVRGGHAFLSENRDLTIVFELNQTACLGQGHTATDLLRAIESHDFQLYLIVGHVLVPRTSADFAECMVADYLALKKGHEQQIPGFEIRDLALDERAKLTVRDLSPINEQNAEHRAHLYVRQALMPKDLREHPLVAATLHELSTARDTAFLEVRAALELAMGAS